MHLLALILLLFPFSGRAADEFHVVFDIDWTLVYPLESAPLRPDSRVVEVGGKWYRYSDGAEEAIERLLERNVKVSFFSGGEAERNIELLRRLKLPSGRNAEEIAYRVLHKEDLTHVSEDKTLKFSQRFKKDLRKISPDLERIVLIDDVKDFTLPGQEKNLLWTGPTYNFAGTFEEAGIRARKNPEWEAPTEAEWRRERAKLQSIVERVERSLDEGWLVERPVALRPVICAKFYSGLGP